MGTLILAVAAGFVIKQKKNSDILISGQIIRFTRSIISISSARPGTAEPQKLQKSIGVSCDPKGCSESGCASDFYVLPRSLNANIPTKTSTIFSPTTIKGQSLGTWSLEWDMPYHANNFLYTTSDQVRYIFITTGIAEDDAIIDELYDEMPDIMGKKEKIVLNNIHSIKERNNYKVKLIYVGETPGQVPTHLSGMNSKDLTAVQIIPSDTLLTPGDEGDRLAIGKLKFYYRSGQVFKEQTPAEEVYYLGRPTVFGAIFSENRDVYKCNMIKALLREKVVSELYLKKVDSLISDNSGKVGTACREKYETAKSHIMVLASGLTLDEAETIKSHSDEIRSQNKNLKLKSCPQIY